jgi:hypothetical protein
MLHLRKWDDLQVSLYLVVLLKSWSAFCCLKRYLCRAEIPFFILITFKTKRKLQMCQNGRGLFYEKCYRSISS